jgi:RNA polymerase sigma factor (sigma-70 family)
MTFAAASERGHTASFPNITDGRYSYPAIFLDIESRYRVHSPSTAGVQNLGDPNVAILQEDLRSSNAPAAWEAFLGQYSPVLYQTALAYSDDEDGAANCFLHICEQLSRNSFRRLLKFKPDGSANFTTWLRVVARNLCFDWHRTQMGRRRPFKSLQSLSSLELDVYDCRFERGLSVEETLQRLCPTSPDLDPNRLVEIERRIEHSLNSRQRWILSTRQKSTFSARVVPLTEEEEESLAQVADTRLDQESLIACREQSALLKKCVAQLPSDERLLVQLRFEQELSFDEIAHLTGLGDAQRAHRRIVAILKKLRVGMK